MNMLLTVIILNNGQNSINQVTRVVQCCSCDLGTNKPLQHNCGKNKKGRKLPDAVVDENVDIHHTSPTMPGC